MDKDLEDFIVFSMTIVAITVFALIFSGELSAHPGKLMTDRYDADIKKASKRYMPGIPWQLWKAQLYQESRLDPNARSPAGAQGIAQFMSPTWREVSLRLGYSKHINRNMAAPAIQAGAFYMSRLRRVWELRSIEDYERHRHALGCYNAGCGNISRAWRLAGKPALWETTAKFLPKITGRFSRETSLYVQRIWQWWAHMSS